MEGPAAAEKIRALGCDAFIVGITGNLYDDSVSYFTACGANKVLPKPLHMPDLKSLWIEYGVANTSTTSSSSSSG